MILCSTNHNHRQFCDDNSDIYSAYTGYREEEHVPDVAMGTSGNHAGHWFTCVHHLYER